MHVGATTCSVHVLGEVQPVSQGVGHPGQQQLHGQPYQLLCTVQRWWGPHVLRWLPSSVPPSMPRLGECARWSMVLPSVRTGETAGHVAGERMMCGLLQQLDASNSNGLNFCT